MAEHQVQFTQFLFPHGERKLVSLKTDHVTAALAAELAAAGWRFECECNPRNSMVMADCCNEEGQLAMTVEPNGTGVPGAIARMVSEAHERWVNGGRPHATSPEGARLVESECDG